MGFNDKSLHSLLSLLRFEQASQTLHAESIMEIFYSFNKTIFSSIQVIK